MRTRSPGANRVAHAGFGKPLAHTILVHQFRSTFPALFLFCHSRCDEVDQHLLLGHLLLSFLRCGLGGTLLRNNRPSSILSFILQCCFLLGELLRNLRILFGQSLVFFLFLDLGLLFLNLAYHVRLLLLMLLFDLLQHCCFLVVRVDGVLLDVIDHHRICLLLRSRRSELGGALELSLFLGGLDCLASCCSTFLDNRFQLLGLYTAVLHHLGPTLSTAVATMSEGKLLSRRLLLLRPCQFVLQLSLCCFPCQSLLLTQLALCGQFRQDSIPLGLLSLFLLLPLLFLCRYSLVFLFFALSFFCFLLLCHLFLPLLPCSASGLLGSLLTEQLHHRWCSYRPTGSSCLRH